MYTITVEIQGGQTKVINPSEAFQPFEVEKGNKGLNNAQCLMIDVARTFANKKAKIVKGSVMNLDNGKENILFPINK